MEVIVSEYNEKWVIHGYVHSLEYCAWSVLQYFIAENTASYGILKPHMTEFCHRGKVLSYKR